MAAKNFHSAAKHETKFQGVHEAYDPTTSLGGIVSGVNNPAGAPKGAAHGTQNHVKSPTKTGSSGTAQHPDSYTKQVGNRGSLHK